MPQQGRREKKEVLGDSRGAGGMIKGDRGNGKGGAGMRKGGGLR